MKRPQSIQISIPNPCSQNWDEMTPTGNGRHCAHCSTTVIDFTTWSDAELYKFFAKNTGHVCGQLLDSQLNRCIHIPPQPHSRLYRMMVAMGLTIITGTYQAQAQVAPLTQQFNSNIQQHATGHGEVGIRGTITDNGKDPITNASVEVYVNEVLKGRAVTDIDGNYSIAPLPSGIYTVKVSYIGYDSKIIANVVVTDSMCKIDTFLKQDESRQRELVITSYRTRGLVEPYRVVTVLPPISPDGAVYGPHGERWLQPLPLPELPDLTGKKRKFRFLHKHK